MKTLPTLTMILALSLSAPMDAQFLKKLVKRAGEVAEETVKRKTEEKSERTTSEAFDSVFNSGKTSGQERRGTIKDSLNTSDNTDKTPQNGSKTAENQSFSATTNFDFVPGDQVLFKDDFSQDALGDFPAKWDTNGAGEIVEVAGEKWLRLANNSTYLPMFAQPLPENYTVSFDLLTIGMDRKTSSQAFLKIIVSEEPGFSYGKNWSMVELSPCQYITSPGVVEKTVDGERQLRNKIGKDYRTQINGRSRVSIAVNKTRMRVWINENKIVDIPRLVPAGIKTFKLDTKGLRDARDQDEIFIGDFHVAESGTDKRSKLITEGILSTNAILFKSGSAEISGGADGVLQEVADAMRTLPDMQVLIVGHTDATGDAATNLALSRKRAETIKMALVKQYDIRYSRIQTDGKGENDPIADNATEDGKARNRRVEFIKQ